MTAALVVTVSVATLYATQILVVGFGAPGLVASVAADLVVLAGVLMYAHHRRVPLGHLGLRGAPARFFVAAVLIGISMWYVSLVLVALIEPPGDTSHLEQIVEQAPLAPTLFALTVFPAVTEELLFRGVLLRSLAARLGAPTAVVISAAVFGLYHLLPPQMLSTFVLGLVLGVLTVRSASLVPAIVVHLINNTIAVLLARDELPGLTVWLAGHAGVALIGALVLAASGLALTAKGVG